jgi:cysteinyl-tRNA synthetase
VCNLTDIDDKIIAKMIAEGKSHSEITTKFTEAFFEDLDVLNIKRAGRYPKATEHLEDMKNMIQTLIDKNYAYIESESVYFRVSAFSTYGKLAKLESNEVVAD